MLGDRVDLRGVFRCDLRLAIRLSSCICGVDSHAARDVPLRLAYHATSIRTDSEDTYHDCIVRSLLFHCCYLTSVLKSAHIHILTYIPNLDLDLLMNSNRPLSTQGLIVSR